MLNLHHPEQFAGPWAIYEPAARAMIDSLSGIDWAAHKAAHAADTRQPVKPRQMGGGVAVLDVSGPLSKYGSSVAPTSYLELRRGLRQAVESDRVSGILLAIESPGGASMGCADLADAIAEAATVKPIHAYIEDLGASAAYLLASQATHISANRSALAGSIGTYTCVKDFSRADEARGITTHVIKAGKHKGIGTPGARVTDDDLAELQRVTDSVNSFFVEAVSTGRGLSGQRLQAVTDGRIHSAAEAKRLGLIDSLGTFEQAVERLAGDAAKPSKTRQPRNPVAAWEQAIKARMDEGMTRGAAVCDIAQNAPKTRERYVAYCTEHPEVLREIQAAQNKTR